MKIKKRISLAAIIPIFALLTSGCGPEIIIGSALLTAASTYAGTKAAQSTAPQQQQPVPAPPKEQPAVQPTPTTAQAPPATPETKPVVMAKAAPKTNPAAEEVKLGKSDEAEVRKIRDAQGLKGKLWWDNTYQKWYVLDYQGKQWTLKGRGFK